MSAEELGRRLLDEVEEEGLDEVCLCYNVMVLFIPANTLNLVASQITSLFSRAKRRVGVQY